MLNYKRFKKHAEKILNSIESKTFIGGGFWTDNAIAIVIVETWFRPFNIRFIEYIKLNIDENTTTGMCQANFSRYWKTVFPVKSTLIRKIIDMENPEKNITVAEMILHNGLMPTSTLMEIIEFYNGEKNLYYLELMCISLDMVSKWRANSV